MSTCRLGRQNAHPSQEIAHPSRNMPDIINIPTYSEYPEYSTYPSYLVSFLIPISPVFPTMPNTFIFCITQNIPKPQISPILLIISLISPDIPNPSLDVHLLAWTPKCISKPRNTTSNPFRIKNCIVYDSYHKYPKYPTYHWHSLTYLIPA